MQYVCPEWYIFCGLHLRLYSVNAGILYFVKGDACEPPGCIFSLQWFETAFLNCFKENLVRESCPRLSCRSYWFRKGGFQFTPKICALGRLREC